MLHRILLTLTALGWLACGSEPPMAPEPAAKVAGPILTKPVGRGGRVMPDRIKDSRIHIDVTKMAVALSQVTAQGPVSDASDAAMTLNDEITRIRNLKLESVNRRIPTQLWLDGERITGRKATQLIEGLSSAYDDWNVYRRSAPVVTEAVERGAVLRILGRVMGFLGIVLDFVGNTETAYAQGTPPEPIDTGDIKLWTDTGDGALTHDNRLVPSGWVEVQMEVAPRTLIAQWPLTHQKIYGEGVLGLPPLSFNDAIRTGDWALIAAWRDAIPGVEQYLNERGPLQTRDQLRGRPIEERIAYGIHILGLKPPTLDNLVEDKELLRQWRREIPKFNRQWLRPLYRGTLPQSVYSAVSTAIVIDNLGGLDAEPMPQGEVIMGDCVCEPLD